MCEIYFWRASVLCSNVIVMLFIFTVTVYICVIHVSCSLTGDYWLTVLFHVLYLVFSEFCCNSFTPDRCYIYLLVNRFVIHLLLTQLSLFISTMNRHYECPLGRIFKCYDSSSIHVEMLGIFVFVWSDSNCWVTLSVVGVVRFGIAIILVTVLNICRALKLF